MNLAAWVSPYFIIVSLGMCINTPVQIKTIERDIKPLASGLDSDEFYVELFVHTKTEPINGSSDFGNPWGHAYLEITNNWEVSTFWQCFELNPGCSMTLSLWGDSNAGLSGTVNMTNHDGIYINREYNQYHHYETPENCRFIMGVGHTSNLWSYYTYISKKYNTYSVLDYNCVNFAVDVFEILTGDKVFSSYRSETLWNTPVQLHYYLSTLKKYNALSGYVQTSTDVFYSYTDHSDLEVVEYEEK